MLRTASFVAALSVSLGVGTVAFAATTLELGGLSKSVDACVDFDEFVNGSWKQFTAIPADRARIGSFDTLRDESRQVVERALVFALRDPARLDTPGKRLAAAYYASGMDIAAIERRGLTSLQPLLGEIDGLTQRSRLPVLLAALAQARIEAPLRVTVAADPKDKRRYIIVLDQSGLGLPDRDDYVLDDARTRELRQAYGAYRLRLARLAGSSDAVAAARLDYALEVNLAKASMSRIARRDPNATYRLFTLDSLAKFAPGLDWEVYFDELGVAQPGEFNVASPEFVKEVARLAATAPLEQWRAYLKQQLLDAAAPALPAAFVDARFAYRGKAIQGLEQPPPRAEQVIGLITGPSGAEPLAHGLGQLYVDQVFSVDAKARAIAMIGDIKVAMRTRIENLDWMSASTKERAVRKLDAMSMKIGYPDHWKSYERLEIEPDDFAGNWLRANSWEYDQRVADLVRPVDRGRWFTSPHVVNAFAGGLNEIVFPAAILQPPFFYPQGDDAANYGAIGAVIGHEITHHFDDRGRQFDEYGNLVDWWTPADAAAYKERAAALANQYSAYKPLPGQAINGQQTLGENISDLGGIKVAFDAFQLLNARAPAPSIDGYTPEQRFFLSYATIWRGKYRNAAMLDQLRTGRHSPSRYRVLGPLANFPAFGEAFGCGPGAPMLRPVNEQILIW